MLLDFFIFDGFTSAYVIFQHCSQTEPNILKLQGLRVLGGFFAFPVMPSPYGTDQAQYDSQRTHSRSASPPPQKAQTDYMFAGWI